MKKLTLGAVLLWGEGHIDELADRLQQLGYSRDMIRSKIRVVCRLSHWLLRHKRGPSDVDGKCLKRFLAYRKRTRCYITDDAAAVRDVEMLLRSHGLIDSHESLPATEAARIVERFSGTRPWSVSLDVSLLSWLKLPGV